jgi:transcription initiation factor IIE alpha subunit
METAMSFHNGTCSECGSNVPDGMQSRHRNFHEKVEQLERRVRQLESDAR